MTVEVVVAINEIGVLLFHWGSFFFDYEVFKEVDAYAHIRSSNSASWRFENVRKKKKLSPELPKQSVVTTHHAHLWQH